MSNNNNTTDPDVDVSTMPPIGNIGGSGYTLLPDVKLPRRTAKGATKTVGTLNPEDVIQSSAGSNEFIYIGQNLVNSSGIVSRGQYTEDEAYSELARLAPAQRRQLQNLLYSVGAYGNTKPSGSGFNSSDFSAMREAMLYANTKGVTLDVATSMMVAEIGTMGGVGGAQRVRTTPKQDLQAVFRQVSSQVLGRRLSDSEVEKFIKAYNQKEVSAAYGGPEAPQASVAAQEAVTAAAPDEADAVGALSLTNIFDDMIKGLG